MPINNLTPVNKLTKLVLILFLAMSPVLFSLLQAQADSDGIAAVVNGELITLKQLDNRIAALTQSDRILSNVDRGQLREKVLDDLIDQELINQAAKAKGIFVTEAEVRDAETNIIKKNHITEAQFRASLAHTGFSVEAFREGLRLEILRNRVMGSKVMSKIVITDSDVQAYLNGEGPRLSPEGGDGRLLRMILIPLNPKNQEASLTEAKRIKDEIESGLSFAEAAAKYSQGPGAANGGDPGDGVTVNKLPPPLQAALANLKPGQPSEPVNAGKALVIFTVAAAASLPPDPGGNFDPETKENARRSLERQKMQQNFTKWIDDLKRNAIIRRR